jgi:hypothetical protein
MEAKKIIPDSPAERGKANGEQVNQDAIKKEEEELAEAEKQAEADNEQKNKELLRKLEEHKEEQKKLLQEQKQILEELKEHKKDFEQAAAKQRNDDNIPQGSSGTVQDVGVKPDGKIDINNKQSVENIPNPQNGVPGIKMVQNRNNVGNDIQKAQSEEAHKQNKFEKEDVPQPVKADAPEKDLAGVGPNHLAETKQLPKNSVLEERPKGASINADNVEMSGSILQQSQGL